LTNNKEICEKTSYKLFNIKKITNNKPLNASTTSSGSQNKNSNSASIMSQLKLILRFIKIFITQKNYFFLLLLKITIKNIQPNHNLKYIKILMLIYF
jgi:hypothetical protein